MRIKDSLFVKMFWNPDNVGHDDIIDLNSWKIDELGKNDREILKILIKCQNDAENRFKVIYNNEIANNFKKNFEKNGPNNIEKQPNSIEAKINNNEKERE